MDGSNAVRFHWRMDVLYLPGLDGEGFCAEKIAEQLQPVRLQVFAYPVGVPLRWGTLCRLVAERVGRTGSKLLIGESFGGAVAQETALRHGGSLRSVFLISTFAHEAEPFASAIGQTAARLLPRTLLRPVSRRLASWKLAGTLQGEERRKFLQRFEALDHRELAARLKLLNGFDTRERLQVAALPFEVMYGTRDTISASPDQLKAWAQMKDCRVHAIEGYGHLVSAEAAPEVARLIEAWALRHAGGK